MKETDSVILNHRNNVNTLLDYVNVNTARACTAHTHVHTHTRTVDSYLHYLWLKLLVLTWLITAKLRREPTTTTRSMRTKQRGQQA